MTQYVAFLRGIMPTNPNMRNEKLRKVFESLGFSNVQTVIASGNVLFESDEKDIAKLQAMIEKAFPKQLKFTSTTIVRSRQQLQKMVDGNPFGKNEDTSVSRFNVTFFQEVPSITLDLPYRPDNKGYEIIGFEDGVLFSMIDLSREKTPDLMSWLEKQFGKKITTRTWKTVSRILKKF